METTPSPHEALKAALAKAGSQSALARICGVAQPTVWKWLQTKRLPPLYVLTVEAATGVSRHHLRPDIYPLEACAVPGRFHGVIQGAHPVAFNHSADLTDGAPA